MILRILCDFCGGELRIDATCSWQWPVRMKYRGACARYFRPRFVPTIIISSMLEPEYYSVMRLLFLTAFVVSIVVNARSCSDDWHVVDWLSECFSLRGSLQLVLLSIVW